MAFGRGEGVFGDEDAKQNRKAGHGRDIVQPSKRAQGVYEKVRYINEG